MVDQVAFLKGDIVTGRKVDEADDVLPLPAALAGVLDSNLRANAAGTAVIDARTVTEFYIDDNGTKHTQNLSPNAASATGVFTLNRRGVGDRIERGTGDTTDFSAIFANGQFVTPKGSAGSDIPLRIDTVEPTRINLDNSFNRIPADENDVADLVIEQGWQRLESIDFRDALRQDPQGLWLVRPDDALLKDGKNDFEAALTQFVAEQRAAIVAQQAPGVDLDATARERAVARNELREDFADPQLLRPTIDDLASDENREAKRIYDQVTASAVDVSVTFNATNRRIERTDQNWSLEGFVPGMDLTITGSTSNDGVVVNRTTAGLNLGLIDAAAIVQEGPVTVTITGAKTLGSYKDYRNDPAEYDKPKPNLNLFMFDAVISIWFDAVRQARRSFFDPIKTATVWLGATSYSVDDYVFDKFDGLFYRCNEAHTSQSDLADDAGKWDLILPEAVVLPAFPTAQLGL